MDPMICVAMLLGLNGPLAQEEDGRPRISLSEAVDRAGRSVPGGSAVAADLKKKGSHPTYRVIVLRGLRAHDVRVDGTIGEILNVEEETADDDVHNALHACQIDLERALEIAGKAVKGGLAYDAELRMDDGRPYYRVKLSTGDKSARIYVDAVNGALIRGSGADAAEEEDTRDPHVVARAVPPPPPPHAPPPPHPPGPHPPARPAPPHSARWSFDGTTTGDLPAGWAIRQTPPSGNLSTWQVVEDPSAPSPPNVLGMRYYNLGAAGFNLALADDTWYKDLDLSVQVKAVRGVEDQGGGPLWRCRDENNYYVCRFNPLEGNFRVYHVVGGRRTQLESASVHTEPDRWYEVRVRMSGSRIACYLDGRKLLEVRDDALPEAGMIGLWTKADAVTSFDNLTVGPLE